MRKLVIVLIVVCLGCSNLDIENPTPRNTYLKFFEGAYSISGVTLEEIPSGYILLGNMSVEDVLRDSSYNVVVVIETDKNGNQVQQIQLPGSYAKALKPILVNGVVTKYVLASDVVVTNAAANEVSNIIISSLKVTFFDPFFNETSSVLIADEINPIREDYSAESITTNSNGDVYVLSTYKRSVANQSTAPAEPMIISFKPDGTIDWMKRHELVGRTSLNSRSLHFRNNRLTWASAIANVAGDFTNSWVAIPVVEIGSIFPSYSLIGQTTSQSFIPRDIKPARSPEFGFGVVGTYSQDTRGSKGNVFFLRVDANGQIVSGSDRYFDTASLLAGSQNNKDESIVIDNGEAITSTQDGGFALIGTFNTNNDIGKGLKDLILIRLDPTGNLIWHKTFGGGGAEVPSAIIETESGDLMIFGTSTAGNYGAMFILKTDKNGEQKN
ncbi:MAG: hypothetical protein J0L66_01425 [Cytophagales bacterium]|nr:hypothetical protein [Cytophagales bacterium]